MTTPEEFMKGKYYIHIVTPEQAEGVTSYYSQLFPKRHNTVDIHNYGTYPWFYYGCGVHGAGVKPRTGFIVEYEEWAAMATPPDFKESDKPLSFLFESE